MAKSFKQREFERLGKTLQANSASGTTANKTSATKNKTEAKSVYDKMLDNALNKTASYARQGTEQTREVANTVQGGMTQLNTGDKKSFSWNTARQAQIDQATALKALRAMKLFDTEDYAKGQDTVNLVSNDYLKELADELPLQRARAAVEDDYNKTLAQMLEKQNEQYPQTALEWKTLQNDLYAMTDENAPIYWAYADYLLNGGRPTKADMEYRQSGGNPTEKNGDAYMKAYYEKWDAMSDEEYAQEYARLEKQFAGLDWDTLTDKDRYNSEAIQAGNYEAQVPAYDTYIKTVNDEIDRRDELEALQANIRGDANYDALSQYDETTREPHKYINLAERGIYDTYVKGYDDLGYFLNVGANDEYSSKELASKNNMLVANYLSNGYDYLTANELADYNALYNAGRFDEAARYLELLRPELLQRRAGVNEQYYRTKAVSDAWSTIGSGVESIAQGVGNIAMLPMQIYETVKGIDNPYSAAYDLTNAQSWTRNEQQNWIAAQETAEWLKELELFGYNGFMGAADNMARLLAAGFNPTVSLIFAGGQDMSGALNEMAGKDASAAAKLIKGFTSGLYGIATEKIGVDALFDMGKDSAIKYFLSEMASELGEETVNTLAEDLTEVALSALFDYESEIKSGADIWDDLVDTAYQTAGSTLFMGGGGALNMTLQNKTLVNRVNQNGSMDTVISIGKELGTGTESYKLAEKLEQKKREGHKLRLNEQGALIRAVTEDVGEQNAQAVQDVLTESVEERLVQLGETEEEAKKTAPAISKMYLGEKLSLKDRTMVNWSENADQVMKELHAPIQEGDTGRTGKEWAAKTRVNVMAESMRSAEKNAKLEKALGLKGKEQSAKAEAGQETQKSATEKAVEAAAESAAKKQEAVKNLNLDAKMVAFSDAGESATGEFQRVEKKDGKLVAVVSSGENQNRMVSLNDVEGTGDAGLTTILEYAQDAGRDMSAAEVNSMIKAFQDEGGDVNAFISGFEDTYLAGYTGLNENQQREGIAAIVYEQGKAEAQQDEQDRLQRVNNAKRTSTGAVTWIGQVKSFSEITGKGTETSMTEAMQTLTESQKDVARVVERFAEKFKVDVALYESDLESPVTLPNGQYDPSTNTVYLDVQGGALTTEDAANMRKNGTLGNAMLKYLGHELTHAIESGSAEGYAAYRQAVKESLRKRGMDYEALVRSKLETAQAQGAKLTLGGAEAEVIADASEYMLENTAFISNTPKGVKARVQKVISDFAKKVRAVFATLTGGHQESQAIRELKNNMYRYVDNLQNLWDIAATEMVDGTQNAAETAQEAEQTVPVEELKPEKQFSMRSDVEKREDGLIAVHNLKADDIMGTLKLGGFPMPSIAIVSTKYGHTKYGAYSVIFGSSTIDPETNKANRVYGADAWTPIFPTVETEILDNEMWKAKGAMETLATQIDEEHGKKATVKVAKQAEQLIEMVQSVPTGYFEAKPMRVVGFDEIAQIIAPDDISGELKTALQERGIPYTTYETGNETDRIEKMNAVKGVQFSLRDTENMSWEDQVNRVFGNKMPRSATLTVNKSNTPIESIGADNLPIGMDIGDFRKVTRSSNGSRSAHALSKNIMLALPGALQNPVAVFDNPTRNSVYVVTDFHDSDGNPVVAIIKKNQRDNVGTPMHKLVSAYGMQNVLQYMQEHIPDGSNFLVDNKKAFSSMAGAQYIMTEADFQALEERYNRILPSVGESVNSKRQYALRDQTETEAFKRWFGNSEVTDDNGDPLVVYHTTRDSFYTFDRNFLGKGTDENAADGYLASTAHVGFWFNTQKLESRGMGNNAMPVYLSAQRLYEAGTLDGLTEEIWDAYDGEYDTEDPSIADATAAGENFRSYLESRGYDGIMVNDTEFGGTSYIVFEPEQIKSATDNVGTFDPQNPDIRYARRDDMTMADVREILSGMEITNRMNDTEKDMLTRYKSHLAEMQKLQEQIDEQKRILNSDEATADEKAAAEARRKIYDKQRARHNGYLRKAEGSNGFARLMATSQELARTLSTAEVDEAADDLEQRIKSIEEQLKTIGSKLETAKNKMDEGTLYARFNPRELDAAAKELKEAFYSTMSLESIRNHLVMWHYSIENLARGKITNEQFLEGLQSFAVDIYDSQKPGAYYESYVMESIAEVIGTVTISEAEAAELKSGYGITFSQYKKELAPYIRVVKGPGSSILAEVQADPNTPLAAMMGDAMNDVDALMILYDTVQSEKANMENKNFPGLTEQQTIEYIKDKIMNVRFSFVTGADLENRLKDIIKRSSGNMQKAAEEIDKAVKDAGKAAKKANNAAIEAYKYGYEAEKVGEYYRALEEKRRLTELKEQAESLKEQLKSEAAENLANKLAEQRERQMDLNAIRAQTEKNRATEKRIRTKVKRLDTLIRRETDSKHIPEGFKPVVEELMRLFINQDGIDVFGNPDTESGQRSLAVAYAAYQQLKETDGTDLNQMSDYYDYDAAQDLLEMKELLKKLGAETNLVGTERLRTRAAFLERAEQIVDEIAHTAENIGKIQIGEKRTTLEKVAGEIREELDKKNPYSEYDDIRGKAAGALNNLRYGNMTPAYFFRDLNLTPMTELSKDLFAAEDKYGRLFREAQDKVGEMEQKYHYWDWIYDEPLTFTTQQGLEVKQGAKHQITINKSMAMQLYATWKRESQKDPLIQTNHLRDGGFEFATMQKQGNKLAADKTPHKIGALDMRTIENYLTDEQKAFADAFVQYLTDLGGTLGNETSMELFGIKKYKDTYYFPIQVARGQLNQSSNAGNSTTDDSRIKHMSFTNRRINGAVKPITISDFVDVGTRHIQQMLTYYAFTVPLENMNKVLNQAYIDENTGSRKTIRNLIEEKCGKDAKDYLERFIADVNGGVRKDSTEKGFIRMLSSFKKGATAASLSVAIQQPTSIIRALAEVPAKYFVPFTHGDTNTQYRKEWEQLTKHSGVAVIKDVGGIDMTRSGSMADDLAGNLEDGYSAFKKVKLALGLGAPKGERAAAAMRQWDSLFGKLAENGDKVAWIAMWRAIKNETKALNPRMDINSDEFLDKAGERFNDVMRLTQVYDSTLARSQWMRSGSGLMKMATSFAAEGTLTANMLYDGFKNGNAKTRAKTAAIFFVSQIITAAAAAIIKAGRDDDEEKTYAEKYLSAMEGALGGWGGAINPLSALPWVRDVMNLLDGYDVERSDMSIVSDLIGEAQKLANGKYKDNPWKAVENAGGAMANAFGVPLKNIMRDARTIRNSMSGLLNPPRESNSLVMEKDFLDNFSLQGIWEPDTSVSAYYAKLYKAMEEGDAQEEADLREYLTIIGKDAQDIKTGLKSAAKAKYNDGALTDEEAIQWLVENGYAEEEDDAYWIVEEWKYKQENGKGSTYSKYADFYAAVESGENLKSTIKHYTDNGVEKSTLSQIITNNYKKQLVALWKEGKKTEFANLQARILTAYEALGYKRADKLKDIQRWLKEEQEKQSKTQ